MLPHDGGVAKRATRTPRFHKGRTINRYLAKDKEMYEHSERLTPTAKRIFDYMAANAPLGLCPMGQAGVSNDLKIPLPTCKAAFAQLQEKRFIARKSACVYMMNPERCYRGVEEQFAQTKQEFFRLEQVYRERMVKRQATPPKPRKAELPAQEPAADYDIDLGF